MTLREMWWWSRDKQDVRCKSKRETEAWQVEGFPFRTSRRYLACLGIARVGGTTGA